MSLRVGRLPLWQRNTSKADFGRVGKKRYVRMLDPVTCGFHHLTRCLAGSYVYLVTRPANTPDFLDAMVVI